MERFNLHISAPDAPVQGKTAMYIGSFNPFTIGHLDIVNQALSVKTESENTTTGLRKVFYSYNKLIICVRDEENNPPRWEASERKRFIELAIKNHPRAEDISVITERGLTVDIAYKHGVTTLIRGVRQGTDDAYNESRLACLDCDMAGMRGFRLSSETFTVDVPFLCDASPSFVRKLYDMDKLTIMANYLPKPIAEEIIAGKLYQQHFIQLFNPNTISYPYWLKLKEAYVGRPYHSMIHLAHMFDQLAIYTENCDKDKNYVKPNGNLYLAIFLHDYVYDVSSKDTAPEHNKTDSAAIVVEWDRRGILQYNISAVTVHRLILATAHNKPCEDNKQKLIADLDLSILGTTRYSYYAAAIREEYAAYSDEEYKKERLAFLSNLLKKKHIFHLDFFRKMFEEQARKNIAEEIKNLQGKA